MTQEQREGLAAKEDYTKVAAISVKEIVIRQEFRLYCEENTCGNYNANYGCPPDCGTPEQMEAKVRKYSRAMVFQTSMDIDDMDDKESIKEIKKEHSRKTRELIDRYEKNGEQGLLILPGACDYCKTCQKATGNPCAFPAKQTSCLSAYGIDVTALAESCHMKLDWSGSNVSYFSLYLYNETK